jgi:signal transduction histidine kinase
MPVRLRITLLFSLLAFIILSLVCSVIYSISSEARVENIQRRLTNRAITTARLLSQREIFDQALIRRIDSSTTIALKEKTVQAYDEQNRLVYRYSDVPNDTFSIAATKLQTARENGQLFFTIKDKEAVAYHYTRGNLPMIIVVAAEDTEGKDQLKNLLRILLVSFLIGNILVWLAGYFFSKRLLQPIRRISDDVAEISAQNLARRIEAGKTKDEWYQLSSTLNDLLNRLQESFDLQRRFIANASHELSTPLTAISSQLEVTLNKERSAEDYKRVMQSIYQDVQQLNKLTQTLLEFAKASGNAGGLEIDLLRIDEIILNIPSEVAKSIAACSVKINFDEMPEEEENLLVFGNEALLFTAIKNIVFNACKFSEDHQALVTLRITDKQIVIAISDKGPGIHPAEMDRIFQPFYRLEEARTTGGFGLGLPLANRIIKMHKGTIDVQSFPGKGTTFTIILPCAKNLNSF